MKKVIALGDLHSGHRAGLTPPQWQYPIRGGTKQRNAWGKSQHETWGAYLDLIEKTKPPIDLLIVNGDLIDGRGQLSGSTELLTTDRVEQAQMAYEALKIWGARKVVISYGTPYHVAADGDDLERSIAESLGGEIHSHPFVEVEGVTFDIKHKVGSSSIPHGRGTPLAKEWLWNLLWAEREEQPKADIILRSHIHYFSYIGDTGWIAMSMPALQIAGTKYGGRQCSGTVDWGLVEFNVDAGEFEWKAHIKSLKANKQEAIKL